MNAEFIQLLKKAETCPILMRTLKRLRKYFRGYRCPRLSDGEFFEKLTSAKTLSLQRILPSDGKPIIDISPLKFAKKLQWLSLGGNGISDLRPLAGLINLETLYLEENNVRDISPLKTLSKLTELHIGENPIENFDSFGYLKSLRILYLKGDVIFKNNIPKDAPQLSSLACFPIMENLRRLLISYVRVNSQSLEGIERFPNLRNLGASTCGITDISHVAHCKKLTYADLNSNEVTDVSALTKLTYLRGINLNNNPLQSVIPLKRIPQLCECSVDCGCDAQGNIVPEGALELESSLSNIDEEFKAENPTIHPSLTLIADDELWELPDKEPFNVADYDGDWFSLCCEHDFVLSSIEEELKKKLPPEEMEYVYIPDEGWGERRSNAIMLEENPNFIKKLRLITETIQKVLCHIKRQWIIFFHTDWDIEDTFLEIWVYRDKIVVRKQDEKNIRKLLHIQ